MERIRVASLQYFIRPFDLNHCRSISTRLTRAMGVAAIFEAR